MTARRIALLAVSLTAALVGCSFNSEASKNYERESSNLKNLTYFLTQYSAQNRGRRPADEAMLRKFLAEYPHDQLAESAAQNLEEILVSERDGQPFAIVYEGQQLPIGPAGQGIVAYEQTGVDGKRRVATVLGAVLDVDDAELTGYLSGKQTTHR